MLGKVEGFGVCANISNVPNKGALGIAEACFWDGLKLGASDGPLETLGCFDSVALGAVDGRNEGTDDGGSDGITAGSNN